MLFIALTVTSASSPHSDAIRRNINGEVASGHFLASGAATTSRAGTAVNASAQHMAPYLRMRSIVSSRAIPDPPFGTGGGAVQYSRCNHLYVCCGAPQPHHDRAIYQHEQRDELAQPRRPGGKRRRVAAQR